MPKVGDKVRVLNDEWKDITEGTEYVVTDIHRSGIVDYYYHRETFSFADDVGELRTIGSGDFDEFELVTEPQPDVTDLIANLGRRVHELESDAVNHPQHYTRGKFETIEVIEHMTQGYADPFVAYCVGNTTKYIDRAPYKHGSPAEDLRKAAWYLTRAADHIEGQAVGDSDV
nr:DUF3310 domain-containing protein [Sporosarcina sp. ACRSL]